jgi:cephalosporin hydroxylase
MSPRTRDGMEIPDILLPKGLDRLYLRPRIARLITRHFAKLYYYRAPRTIFDRHWLGHSALKYPTDLWVYQELMSEVRPNLLVETGTWMGGTGLYFAHICELLGEGRVISIDIEHRGPLPEHPRLEFLRASSTAPETIDAVKSRIEPGGRVMVVLDSDHSRDHVLAELRAYAPLVTRGSYMIVEDTNVNGNPVLPDWGPGPMEAVREFLAERDDFVVDRAREDLLLTAGPSGFLRRVG